MNTFLPVPQAMVIWGCKVAPLLGLCLSALLPNHAGAAAPAALPFALSNEDIWTLALSLGLLWVFILSRRVTAHRCIQAQLEEQQRRLRHSEALYQSLVQHLPAGVAREDAAGRVLFANGQLLQWLNRTLDDTIGKTVHDLLPQELAAKHALENQAVLAEGRVFDRVETYLSPDGQERFLQVWKTPVRDSDNAVVGVQIICWDVTNLKLAEIQLANEREQFRALLDTSPECIYFKDLHSRFVRISRALAERFHLDKAALAHGRTDFDFFSEDHARQAFEDEQEIIRTGRPVVSKLERETYQDGSATWALTTKMPWYDSGNRLIGTFGISRNVTELKQAEERLEQVHRELISASRKGGMAEVATGVLHNVGNVLNSVNVSANLIADRLKRSRLFTLTKVVQLMREHEDDLGAYITADERGRQIPGYLAQLSEYVAQEQATVQQELHSLLKNIEHIKEIVSMQQSYAKAVGAVEQVSLAEVVDDALRMHEGAYARHGIKVVKHYAEVHPIRVDRHRVLEILVNLFSNAKYACHDAQRPDKSIQVRIVPSFNSRLQVEVSDNGIGIPHGNLTKIFSHGFTTRRHGHGFGLHSSALAARELGGCLSAFSEGPGRGATFTVQLPSEPPARDLTV